MNKNWRKAIYGRTRLKNIYNKNWLRDNWKSTKSKEIFVQIWERKVWKAILVIKDLSETFNNHYFNIIEKRTEWKEKIDTDLRKFCDMDIDSDI